MTPTPDVDLFAVPNAPFSAAEFARNMMLEANQGCAFQADHLMRLYKNFWHVAGGLVAVDDGQGNLTEQWQGGGSDRTAEEMQAILNIIGAQSLGGLRAVFANMMTAVNTIQPGAIPDAYATTAWDVSVDPGTGAITVNGLRAAWQKAE